MLALTSVVSADRDEALPNLSGNYDIATLTPLERPKAFGDSLYLTARQADKIAADEKAMMIAGSRNSNPDREAPPDGGDGSRGAAGNVGGYNSFWIDRGEDAFSVDGKFRTSIIHEPADGRRPELTALGKRKQHKRISGYRPNKGDAWWLEEANGEGPYDDPELRSLAERCLLGFGSTSGPPMLPVLYNNVKRIVQTEDHIMILNEMVHDARIIRLNAEHLPDEIRKWNGDSIGHWEGKTLVVDTTNFNDRSGLGLASRHLHVVEKFKRLDDNSLLYSFTVEDPTIWADAWSGEYPWPLTKNSVFEYACHEGNYALGNVLRGARLLEADVIAQVED
jgi:hypothetical protein